MSSIVIIAVIAIVAVVFLEDKKALITNKSRGSYTDPRGFFKSLYR